MMCFMGIQKMIYCMVEMETIELKVGKETTICMASSGTTR